MTQDKHHPTEDNERQLLEEICENTRAIRRVTNRILDHLHEYQTGVKHHEDDDEWNWDDMSDQDDMYL